MMKPVSVAKPASSHGSKDEIQNSSSVVQPASSHGASDSSVVKPAASAGAPEEKPIVVISYNVTWENGKLEGKERYKHELAFKNDLDYAFDHCGAVVILLCECGVIW